METITLGRTGLQATIMGAGAGGPSRVGQSTGRTTAESVRLLRQALDAGVNLIDTAEAYDTESIVGQAICGLDRTSLILSTKKRTRDQITGEDVRQSLEASLKRLGTDYVDIYHLHAVEPQQYDEVVGETLPTLLKLRDEGKVRFLGITERFRTDPTHLTLRRTLQDDWCDVVMVGFNILNQSARDRVFPLTQAKNVGVLIMFAVRLALSRPPRLAEIMAEIIDRGEVDQADLDDLQEPLNFVVHESGAVSIPDAAYRFVRYEPGVDVVLSGTGSESHLQANLASFARPPLPQADVERLKQIFRRVNSVSAQ